MYDSERAAEILIKQICGRVRWRESINLMSLSGIKNILELFFLVHDPTTINRQGNDIGKHYRSIILYHYDEELDFIKNEIDRFNKDYYDNGIVTEIKKFEAFYSAEEYHQEYYKKNSEQPYCKIVIKPKLQKARELLKSYY